MVGVVVGLSLISPSLVTVVSADYAIAKADAGWTDHVGDRARADYLASTYHEVPVSGDGSATFDAPGSYYGYSYFTFTSAETKQHDDSLHNFKDCGFDSKLAGANELPHHQHADVVR